MHATPRVALVVFLAACQGAHEAASQPENETDPIGSESETDPPQLEGVQISPEAPSVEQELEALVSGPAAEDASAELRYAWWVDGELRGDQSVLAQGYSRGQEVLLEVTPLLGDLAGDALRSEPVVIENAPPRITALSIELAEDASAVTAVAQVGDADGDPVEISYRWLSGGVEVGTGSVLTASDLEDDSEIVVQATPFDGIEHGEMVEASDDAPVTDVVVIDSVEITPADATALDDLHVEVRLLSGSLGTAKLEYEWRVDGVVAGTDESLPAGTAVREQEVVVELSPTGEGVTGSPATSDPLVISNAPPSLSEAPALDLAVVQETSTVQCLLPAAEDPDGDSVDLEVEWLVNGSVVASGGSLTGANFDRGNSVACRVSPSDGMDVGDALSSAAVTVSNTPPVVDSVSLLPALIKEDSVVTADVAYVDPDPADIIEIQHQWFVDGAEVSSADTIDGSLFDEGQEIQVFVRAVDGTEPGLEANSPVSTVLNSTPEITVASLLPDPPSAAEDVQVIYEVEDADPGDAPGVLVSWWLDGSPIAEEVDRIDGSLLTRDATLEVVLTPYDEGGAPPMTLSTTVANSAPGEPEVTLSLSPPLTDEDLVCEVATAAEDPDGDAVDYIVNWTVNGAPFPGGGTTVYAGDTVPAAATQTGQTWRCEVVATDGELEGPSVGVQTQIAPQFLDYGAVNGFGDGRLGYYTRGRACVTGDYNADGWPDIYVGSPGDTSYILLNSTPGPGAPLIFDLLMELPWLDLAWAGSSTDYDNDGDLDIFISAGGNEGPDHDSLLENQLAPGESAFVDVTAEAGVAGPIDPSTGMPFDARSAGAVWADYDADGDDDLFVSGNSPSDEMGAACPTCFHPMDGQNILWRNEGGGVFSDVTASVGIHSMRASRHSTFLDIDNDGDLDLYENNYNDFNILWRNELVESGVATFTDVTVEWSPPGEDIALPFDAFASTTGDFNQDGWQDLMVFAKSRDVDGGTGVVYEEGHALFLNTSAIGVPGFVNVSRTARINAEVEDDLGVMGCQAADLNGDNIPDLYVGNGGPDAGYPDFLYVSNGFEDLEIFEGLPSLSVPVYEDWTELIDHPQPSIDGIDPVGYPYRTHGTCIADFDRDGMNDIAVINGGPSNYGEEVREPNRMFQPAWDVQPDTLSLRLIGDGLNIGTTAIGARIKTDVVTTSGVNKSLWNVVLGGSAFSAHNGYEQLIGLKDVAVVQELTIYWPDGTTKVVGGPIDTTVDHIVRY